MRRDSDLINVQAGGRDDGRDERCETRNEAFGGESVLVQKTLQQAMEG